MHSTSEIDLPEGALSLIVSASTDTGHVRAVNEDSYIANAPLFVVADGMGGHERGDRASQTVAAVLSGLIEAGSLPTPELVLSSIEASNEAVRSLSDGERILLSGTTLVGVVLVQALGSEGTYWMAFNIGDSRVYSWDGRELVQLSVDHSAVQEMVDAGMITVAESLVHPDRNVITRAVGASVSAVADIWLLPTAGAQTFLLCSDGLTKELSDSEIAAILTSHSTDTVAIADALVAAALDAGGRDNVTVVVVEASMAGSPVDDENTVDRAAPLSAVLEDTRPRA